MPLRESQGQYRYDPSQVNGPARLFPYVGEDGLLRYLGDRGRHTLLDQGRLSQPLSLLLHQVEKGLRTLEEGWLQLSTLLVDLEIFQSGWFNPDLPPDEQFSADFVRQRREMAIALKAAREAAQSCSEVNRPAEMRSRFYQALAQQGRSRPAIAAIHQRDGGLGDGEFARQRLAGQNPMVLRRIQSTEPSPWQTWNQMEWALADGLPLDLPQAATENRLFLVDYPQFQLATTDLQAGRYVGSPIALFYRRDCDLEPVLIQLEPGRIVTPLDGADDWMRAKLSVQVADVTHHELLAHLGYTHLAMEAFAIATPRQLPANHPLYRLLRPHFQFLLAINTRGNRILLGEGAAIDTLMAPTRTASLDIIHRAYRQRSIWNYALPQDIQQRGIGADVLPDFPYRDDAELLWQAIARYVAAYLHRYYPDDPAVQQDADLQAWAAELGTPLNARPQTDFPSQPAWMPADWWHQSGLQLESLPQVPRVPDFPARLTNLQQVIDLASLILFTCAPQHAAVNFSQFDYSGYVPNAPLAAALPADQPGSPLEILPSLPAELGQMELTFALSGIRYGHLGNSAQMGFTDRGDRAILEQFQLDLKAIEDTIHQRNEQRFAISGISYPYLLPSHIPNSINI